MPEANPIGSGFDRLTSIYDFCVWLAFGNTFKRLAHRAIQMISPVNQCLIIGGGTGHILKQALSLDLAQHYSYAELSKNMRKSTKRRLTEFESNKVDFMQNFHELNHKVDLIVLPFILDCYEEASVLTMLDSMKDQLTDDGGILVIDFNEEEIDDFNASILQKIFIKTLFLFFRFATNIQATKLPRIFTILPNSGLNLAWNIAAKNGWIQASFWHKDQTQQTSIALDS